MKKIEGLSAEAIQRELKAAQEDIDQSSSGDFYDKVIINDDLETAYKALEELIYEMPTANGVHKDEVVDEDITMKDGANGDHKT